MQSFPQPLSVEEENEAIERWEQGDREARNILIERNLRLVAYLVKKYSNSDHSVDDLISIGTIGLIKAVDTYRMGKGVRLATYASRCIDNAIQRLGWIICTSKSHHPWMAWSPPKLRYLETIANRRYWSFQNVRTA